MYIFYLFLIFLIKCDEASINDLEILPDQRVLRENKKWLEKYEVPEILPPIAWCSNNMITVAVPGYYNHNFKNSSCVNEIYTDFFQNEDGWADAWVAKAGFYDCGTELSSTAQYDYFFNLFRPQNDRPGVIVVCACSKDHDNNYNMCVPTARWEDTYIMDDDGDSLEIKGIGFPISASATAGKYNEFTVIPDNEDNFVFTSVVYQEAAKLLYPWPMQCSVNNENNKIGIPFIINGCPISKELGFQLITLKQGLVTFSIKSFIIDNNDYDNISLIISCEMLNYEEPQDIDNFCESKVIHLQMEDNNNTIYDIYDFTKQENQVQQLNQKQEDKESFNLFRKLRKRKLQEMPSWLNITDFSNHRNIRRNTAIKILEDQKILHKPEQYTPHVTGIFEKLENQYGYDDWSTSWKADFKSPGGGGHIQVPNAKVSGYYDKPQQSLTLDTNLNDIDVHTKYIGILKELGIGVFKNDIGVQVERGQLEKSTVIKVKAKSVEVDTLVDILDKDFGQRVKVGDFQIGFRHDFDEYIVPDDAQLATEFLFQYKKVIVGVGADRFDEKYGVTVGANGYQISMLNDLNEFEYDFQANWGNGWKLLMSTNLPDKKSKDIYAQFGFGKINKAYVDVGVGNVGNKLKSQVEFQTKDIKTAFGFHGIQDFNYKINVGKFSYKWKSTLTPSAVNVPIILK